MARITVAYEALEKGQFPPVCCKTGNHTENHVRWRFVQTPAWTWILLPFGFIPFVIARLFAAQRFEGVLPMTPDFVRRMGRLSAFTLYGGLLGVGAFFAGVFTATDAGVIAGGVLAVLAALSLLAATIMSPDCKRDLQRGAAELSSVHERFVETIESAWAQAGQQ